MRTTIFGSFCNATISHSSPRLCDTGFNFTETLHVDTYPFIDPLKSSDAHKDHSVFITGASKGLGRSTAISFARAGASKIGIGARSSLDSLEVELLEAASKAGHPAPQVVKVQLDVLDKESVKKSAQEVEKAFGEGGVDILINNAGWLEIWRPMGEIDVDDWWYTWEVNVKGVFLVTHAFLSLVLKSKEKTIVNLSSIGALLMLPGVSNTLAFPRRSRRLLMLRFALMPGFSVSVGQTCHPAPNRIHECTLSWILLYSPIDQSRA